MKGWLVMSTNCPDWMSAGVPCGMMPVEAGGKECGVGGNWASTSTLLEETRLCHSVGHALAEVGAVCSLILTPGCAFSNSASTFWVWVAAAGFVHIPMVRGCAPEPELLPRRRPQAERPTGASARAATPAPRRGCAHARQEER